MESKIDKFYDFEDLYESRLNMGERYKKIKKELGGRVAKLCKTLTEEQKSELQSICLLYYQREYEAKKAAYKEGFKTGLGLALEAISGKN